MRNHDEEMPFRNRKLLELIESQANGNVSEFAKKIGKSQQVVNRLFVQDKRNGKYPTVSNEIEKAVIDAFGLDELYFSSRYGDSEEKMNRVRDLMGDSQKLKENAKGKNDRNERRDKTKPRLPVKVAAGQLAEYYSGVLESQCERAPYVTQFGQYNFTMIVQGDSMIPKFESGDELACLKVNKILQWGRCYVLDTADGAFLKRIYDDGEYIRCVSYNDSYPPFRVHKNDIFGIYRVVGLMRYNI